MTQEGLHLIPFAQSNSPPPPVQEQEITDNEKGANRTNPGEKLAQTGAGSKGAFPPPLLGTTAPWS